MNKIENIKLTPGTSRIEPINTFRGESQELADLLRDIQKDPNIGEITGEFTIRRLGPSNSELSLRF